MNNLATTRLIRLALPAGLLLACSLLIWVTDTDLRLARAVYEPERVWPGLDRFPWNLLYDYAAVPALLLAGTAGGVLIASLFVMRLVGRWRQALFILLMLALGPGLLVNALFKDHLGRARPIDVHQFGGDFGFTQFWQPGTSSLNKSFPSGHAAIAFYVIAPWFVLRRRKPGQAVCWLAGGLGYGMLIGAGRILQGGHFLSDVLWAGGLVYLSGEILAQVMSLDRGPTATEPHSTPPP
ncbi:MAG: phosphatase PAP2 family protein [Desulfobulbaceae bacterium]